MTGFRLRYLNAAKRVEIGDKFLYYLTTLGRWCGVAEVASACYVEETPKYQDIDDPYIVRFRVKSVTWLSKEKSIPIRDPRVWQRLSFTSKFDPKSNQWTVKFRSSLNSIEDSDGAFLEQWILNQNSNGEIFEFDEQSYARSLPAKVLSADGPVKIVVPEKTEDEFEFVQAAPESIRESIKIQAKLARIGVLMGMQVWVPKSDRAAVLREWKDGEGHILDGLPFDYGDGTTRTIEQIDVLWIQQRYVVRAFEVEHTTSVYSGILRMADLLALQPNLNMKLHIVAPNERKEKVLRELHRPVFSLLQRPSLSDACTYLSYESVAELDGQKLLHHLSHTVIDDYIEEE